MSSRLVLALIVFFARVIDVSMGTIRHVMVIRGKRPIAVAVAFVESLVWVYAVSGVLQDLSDPTRALAFAGGFATGTFTGMTIEKFLKIGEQAVRVFSVKGHELATVLRDSGFRVTSFDGEGRNGQVVLLYVQSKRREVQKIFDLSRKIDPACYLVVEDIRLASYGVSPSGK